VSIRDTRLAWPGSQGAKHTTDENRAQAGMQIVQLAPAWCKRKKIWLRSNFPLLDIKNLVMMMALGNRECNS
jgi:5'(3')-deoxyribonucleotidase